MNQPDVSCYIRKELIKSKFRNFTVYRVNPRLLSRCDVAGLCINHISLVYRVHLNIAHLKKRRCDFANKRFNHFKIIHKVTYFGCYCCCYFVVRLHV